MFYLAIAPILFGDICHIHSIYTGAPWPLTGHPKNGEYLRYMTMPEGEDLEVSNCWMSSHQKAPGWMKTTQLLYPKCSYPPAEITTTNDG